MTARPRPLRVALTGGIASGKSHCQNLFVALGAPVVDADALAHAALAPGTDGAAEVQAAFGTVDRAKLGQLVFQDSEARRRLEAIVHPRVYEGIESFFRSLKASAPFGIADIPLLFETDHLREYDRVIITSCRVDQQRERLVARGLSAADADARIASQLPFGEKMARAEAAHVPVDVIDTSGTFEHTDGQVVRIMDVLSSLPPRVCS